MKEGKHLKRKWKMFIIHHTHTDIGYTDPQEVIEKRQIDYIRQAVEISESIRSGNKKEWNGFKWVCESFWGVDRFWKCASDTMKERLLKAIEIGDIEITGNYLNLNETIDEETLRYFLNKAQDFSEKTGKKITSAMTADINGYSWGYAQALFDAGIRNLYTCVHTHHGMFPLFCKQKPFYWETDKGDKLLVWNGEHYMFGNDLGIVPGAISSYMVRDELNILDMDQFQVAEKRIYRYLEQLEKDEYPFDFIPVNVSGLVTDNAPPNGEIMKFVNAWNRKYGDSIVLEMCTLNSFFEYVRNSNVKIETYQGDWPDWWSEGQAASYEYTKTMRQAQRKLRMIKQLDPDKKIVNEKQLEEIYYNIMMYAEHTFSYSSSMEEPWADMVKLISNQKYMYAVKANQLCNMALGKIKENMGNVELSATMPRSFKVINPYSDESVAIHDLYIENWEKDWLGNCFQIFDVHEKKCVPYQVQNVARGIKISILVKLQPKEIKIFEIRPGNETLCSTVKVSSLTGADGVMDIKRKMEYSKFSWNEVETPNLKIKWTYPDGIVSWYDKSLKREILSSKKKGNMFTPIYEITPLESDENICSVRRKMGRNRKGENVVRSMGELKKVKCLKSDKLFTELEFCYSLEGTELYVMLLRLYHGISRVDASIRINKKSVWEPENIYIALPVDLDDGQLWIDKMGRILRPGLEQLPGTNIDFYCVQEGIGYIGEKGWIAIATPDNPLIQLGRLEYGDRLLNEMNTLDHQLLYSWAFNNFWETNFDASVGGFHQLNYSIETGGEKIDPNTLQQKLKRINDIPISIRVKNS